MRIKIRIKESRIKGQYIRLSDAHALANRAQVHAAGQEYDVQKNRQNGEEITVARLAPNDALDAGPMHDDKRVMWC